MGSQLTSQAKRQELWLLSTPLRAAQASPEGWEKPPEWLGWTSDSRGQPSPSGAERCSQGCLWSWQPGHCGGTCGEGGGATTELRVAKLAQVSVKAGAKRPKSAWRWNWAVCPGPRRGELSRPHSFSAQPGFGGGRQAPQSQSPRARTTLCPGHPTGPSPRSHTPDRALGASQSLGKLQVSWGNEEKGHRAKGNREGEEQCCGLA